MSSPAQRREVVQQVIEQHDYSERRACALVGLNRRAFRRPAPPDADYEVRQWLRELAQERPRFGSPRLHVLLRREGLVQNHKRTERLYRAEGLSLRLKRRKKRPSHLRVVMPMPNGADESWAMDFVADTLVRGRRIPMLTIIDAWNRECPHIEVDFSLTGVRVARVLEQLRQRGRRPNLIQVDNGPEFVSKALDAWAHELGVKLQFIRPGKPVENAHIESFNSRLREECLNSMRSSVLTMHASESKRGERTTTPCARIVPWGNWRRTNSGNCINRKTASPLTYEWCTRRGKVRPTRNWMRLLALSMGSPISIPYIHAPGRQECHKPHLSNNSKTGLRSY